jgi:hypothetical protein
MNEPFSTLKSRQRNSFRTTGKTILCSISDSEHSVIFKDARKSKKEKGRTPKNIRVLEFNNTKTNSFYQAIGRVIKLEFFEE